MVFCVESNSFAVEVIDPQNTTLNKVELNGFPTFFDSSENYIEPLNYWFNHLKNIRRSKDLNSSTRALKRYWGFLETHQRRWDNFPKQKTLKPSYLFRNHDLLQSVKEGKLTDTNIPHIVWSLLFFSWHDRDWDSLIRSYLSTYTR